MQLQLIAIIAFILIILGLTFGLTWFSRKKTPRPMNKVPLYLGAAIGVMTLMLILNFDNEIIAIPLLGICYLVQLFFFIRLNMVDKKFTIAAFTGIFGIICTGLSITAPIITRIFDIYDPLINQIPYIMLTHFAPCIMIASLAILCGTLDKTESRTSNICFALIIIYIITNSGLHYILDLFYDKLEWDKYRELSEIITKIYITAPLWGWAALLIFFNLKPAPKPVEIESDNTIIHDN